MKTALERVGDRILRIVLPQAEASACYDYNEWYSYEADNYAYLYYSCEYTCTSEQGCHVYGPNGYNNTTWNGYC